MPGSALGPRSSTACACREQPSRACTRGQEAPGWRGAPGDCALGELLDGCAAAGPPPSADASSSGGRAASPCPSACSQRPHRDGTDSVPCEHLSARTEPAGRLTERLLPGSLLDLIKKKKKILCGILLQHLQLDPKAPWKQDGRGGPGREGGRVALLTLYTNGEGP